MPIRHTRGYCPVVCGISGITPGAAYGSPDWSGLALLLEIEVHRRPTPWSDDLFYIPVWDAALTILSERSARCFGFFSVHTGVIHHAVLPRAGNSTLIRFPGPAEPLTALPQSRVFRAHAGGAHSWQLRAAPTATAVDSSTELREDSPSNRGEGSDCQKVR